MSVITTSQLANPKPVRRFNWLGQPMEDGDSYYGDPGTESGFTPDEKPQRISAPRKAKPKRTWSEAALTVMRNRMAHARAVARAKREAGAVASSDVDPTQHT